MYDGSYDDFEEPIIRGDDYEFPFVVRLPDADATAPYGDDNTTRVDLSGWVELWCTGKERYQLAVTGDTPALFQVTRTAGGIVVTDAAQGEAKVVLTPDETGALPPGESIYVDVQGKDANGKIHTLATGIFPVRADVTRTTSTA